jgi:hypothetical protein
MITITFKVGYELTSDLGLVSLDLFDSINQLIPLSVIPLNCFQRKLKERYWVQGQGYNSGVKVTENKFARINVSLTEFNFVK